MIPITHDLNILNNEINLVDKYMFLGTLWRQIDALSSTLSSRNRRTTRCMTEFNVVLIRGSLDSESSHNEYSIAQINDTWYAFVLRNSHLWTNNLLLFSLGKVDHVLRLFQKLKLLDVWMNWKKIRTIHKFKLVRVCQFRKTSNYLNRWNQ